MIGRIRNTHLRRLVLVVATPVVTLGLVTLAFALAAVAGLQESVRTIRLICFVATHDLPRLVADAWRVK